MSPDEVLKQSGAILLFESLLKNTIDKNRFS